MDLARCAGAGSPADGDHGVALLDQAVDRQRGAARELVVLDLGVELVLAHQVLEPRKVPDDVVGQAHQDRGVVAPPEPLEVGLDDSPV